MVAIVTCSEDAGLLAHFLLFLLCHLPTDKEADDNDDDDEECHHAHGDANDGTRAYAAPRRVCDLVGHRLTWRAKVKDLRGHSTQSGGKTVIHPTLIELLDMYLRKINLSLLDFLYNYK